MERPLDPDEAALWRRVVATVRPAARAAVAPARAPAAAGGRGPILPGADVSRPAERPRPAAPAGGGTAGLDGSWDRQLGRGAVRPDRIVDLHGDTLAHAYGRIDAALAGAAAAGERIVLLVTGKPGGERTGRGAIRAVVGDWLAASRHAGRIVAVRPAHPRHGGAGALYVVLRGGPGGR